MIKDIIDQIKKSEEKAQEIITSSKKESSEIIEKAYQKANKEIRDAEQKSKKMIKEAGQKAALDAGSKKVELETQYDKKIKAIRDKAGIKEEEVIKKLISRVID